ncbi:MAG: hypothetical protein V7607_746 [Solirubrobacteraceae bacterium]
MSGHVLQVFQPDVGGVPGYVATLVEGLIDRGWQVTVASPPRTTVSDRLRDAGVAVVPGPISRAPRLREEHRVVSRLVARCRSSRVDVVHAHSTKAGLVAGVAGRAAGVPTVYTPHAWCFDMKVPAPLRLAMGTGEAIMARFAHSAIAVVSEHERRLATTWAIRPSHGVHVIRTGLPDGCPRLDRRSARRALGLAAQGFVAAWVGRLGPQKQPDHLAPIARHAGPAVRIAALGGGLASSPAGTALVAAGGTVVDERADARLLYAAADAYVQTSAWEGLPLSVLEAMQASLPVVAYAVGGVREQVRDGTTGSLVAAGDVGGLARALIALAGDASLARRQGAAGQRVVGESFRHDAMIGAYETLYREVAA